MRVVGIGSQILDCSSEGIQIFLPDTDVRDDWEPKSGAKQLTLLGPEGPIDLQITSAISCRDSFATTENRITAFLFI